MVLQDLNIVDILVSETGRPSIHKYYLAGPKAGKSEYFVENLPGNPDGLSTGLDGKYGPFT